MATPEEDYSSLPLTERITHKVWKVRVGAYEELSKKFSQADPSHESEFRPYDGFLKNIATDANAVAQETDLIKTRGSIIPAVVEKGFGSSRSGTKSKALELIYTYIEVVDSLDQVAVVVEDVLGGLNAKQPKIVATTVLALKEIIRHLVLYGAKTVNVKPILKTLSKIFGHTDKNVRAEGTGLVIELYKWLGQAINPHLQELKPVQVKELNEAFEKLPQEKVTQQRFLRLQKETEEAEKDEEAEAEEEKEIDVYDLAEPVDVLSKIPKDFYTQLQSSKWKDRKEALDGLLEICKTPRIVDNNYGELVGALTKRISDSNILVVTLAANIIEALALGLREAFGKYKSTVTGPMIEKLKERKQSVVDALASALDAIFNSVTISDVTEDIVAAGKHKNPQGEIKALIEMMVKASEDSFEPVRVSAAEGLGTMMKVIGEKAMNPFIEGLDDIKKGKIKEAFEKAEVKVKATNAKRPPPAAAPTQTPKAKPAAKVGAKKDKKDEESKKDEKKVAEPPKASKPAIQSKKAAKPSATSAPSKKGTKAKEEEPLKYKFSNEETESRFADMVPEEQTADMGDKNWKLRLAAIENLYNTLNEMDPSNIEAELVVRFLAKKPGWKESNFQVLSKAFNIMELIASKIPSFGKPAAALAIPVLLEKLGDIKLKKSAGETLTAFAEKTSLQFVLGQSYEPLKKAKSPKVLADSLTWFHSAIMEFGIVGVQVRELIDFIKFTLTSSNAAVRTNSVTVLGALRIYVGPDIRTFVQDLNPTQLATIDVEFEKVADQAPPQPTKTSVEVASSGRGGNDALDELFPKVDISAQFTSKMMTEANDDKWKTRKEALEQVLAIVDANKRIKPSLGEFPSILKLRLADSNKNLQMMALDICGKLATAMGKPFDRYTKMLVGPVTAVLTDQKATVRGSAIGCLDCLATANGLDPMVSSFATSLSSENPLLRKDLLSWLSDRLKDADEKKTLPDLQPLVPPILSCLQDRNGDVRKAAQSCLGPIVKSAGYDYVVTKCGDLKGAVKQTIMPMIEAVRPAHGTGPLPRGKDAKKMGAKSRLALPSGSKDSKNSETDASDDVDDDDTPKLPPGLKLKPPSSLSANNGPPPSSLIAPNPPSSLIAPNPPSSLIAPNKLPSPAQRGGLPPSGIGRGLPAPSRLQFSKFRQGQNGQASSHTDSSDEPDQKKESMSMDIDKVEYSATTNSENSTVVNSSGIPPPTRQRTTGNVFLVEVAISKIMSFEHQQSIEALKELDKHLNNSPESIIPYVDELVNALTIQVRMSYTQLDPQSQTLVRLCKHLVNALVLLFSNKNLALAVSQESLERLLSELAHRLLDLNLQVLEAGQQLSKALNVSMVKVLENSNQKSSANLREVDTAAVTTHTKFTELIMKCLWKLARSVQENLKSEILLPNKLLRDLNNFFLAIPPAEWKRRASEKVPLGEMPLRTVKTLLVELVTGLGEKVFDHLDLIEDPQRSYMAFDNSPSRPSSIGSGKSAGNETTLSNFARSSPVPEVPGQINETQYNSSEPASPASPMTPRFPTPTNNNRSSGSHEVEMNSRLTQIFLKIGTREETKQGIYELYEFQKQHPEMESKVTSHLSKTGPYFQSYIRRGLANIAAEEEEKERANVIAEVKTLFPLGGNSAENGQTE
ncbi:17160_t:CDS:10, partial [Dentiscutata erythropus]